MARVTFDFDSDGYINVRGEKYSALEILNDAGQTALDWMLEQDNDELKNIANSWGLKPENDDRTGSKEEVPEGQADDKDDNTSVDESLDKSETGGGLSAEELASTSDKLNILFGFKMKNGVVQRDKSGKPERNSNAAIKTSAGVEPKVQSDGTIDIPGDVTINLLSKNKSLNVVENGKFTIKFGKIDGNFICRGVKLTSLEGGPKIVNGTCDYSKNEITSLTGSPNEVVKFIADDNPKLTTLAGGPKKIKGITDPAKSAREVIYSVVNCALTSLENNGITEFGPGGFDCSKNKLTSLNGLGVLNTSGVVSFYCAKNDLSSLNGVPKPRKDVKTGKPGNYDISHNLQISTFPQFFADFEVDDFKANGLALTSLSFAPKQVFGNFECLENKSSTKLTNQSIGKDRFKPTGFEEVAGNRIVKIDGEFITSEGTWKDKTYDSNTSYKEGESKAGSISGATTSGNIQSFNATTSSGGKVGVKLTEFNPSSATILYKIRGKYKSTTGFQQWEFELFKGPNGGSDGYLRKSYSTSNLPTTMPGQPYRGVLNQWPNAKNFINLSLFEPGNQGWGWGQPYGAFIIDGKNYGAKTNEASSTCIITSPSKAMVSTSDLFVGVAANKGNAWDGTPGKSLAGVKLAAPGGTTRIKDNKVVSWAMGKGKERDDGWPFIGILKDGNWFAGVANSGIVIADLEVSILNYFNSKGKYVSRWMYTDGGTSRCLFVNGNLIAGGGRAVPVYLAW